MTVYFIYFEESVVQYQNPITINYTMKSMGYRDYRAVCEFRPNCPLNEIVSSKNIKPFSSYTQVKLNHILYVMLNKFRHA